MATNKLVFLIFFKIFFIKKAAKKRISIDTPKGLFEKRSKKKPAKSASQEIRELEGLKNKIKNKKIKTKLGTWPKI